MIAVPLLAGLGLLETGGSAALIVAALWVWRATRIASLLRVLAVILAVLGVGTILGILEVDVGALYGLLEWIWNMVTEVI